MLILSPVGLQNCDLEFLSPDNGGTEGGVKTIEAVQIHLNTAEREQFI